MGEDGGGGAVAELAAVQRLGCLDFELTTCFILRMLLLFLTMIVYASHFLHCLF